MELLWVSAFTPLANSGSAGSKTLDYYFSNMLNNPEYSISLLSIDWYNKTKLTGFDWSIYGKCARASVLYNDGNIVEKGINFLERGNLLDSYANLISPLMVKKTLSKLNEWKLNGYKPDVIILEWTNMVVLAEKIKELFPDAKLVASEHDVTFVGYKRKADYYTGIKQVFWKIKSFQEKKIELKSLKLCDLILPQNPDNVKLLEQEGISPDRLRWLVPYYNNLGQIDAGIDSGPKRDILFFGAMSRMENLLSAEWFIEKVMPLIADLNIRFVILGSNPPEKLKALQNERVIVTGFVENIAPYFAASLCMVAPLVLGAGIKVKVIEGLSSGIPVLTNTVGIEGIPAKNNQEYCHCETPEEYEACIRKLLTGELNTIGSNGRIFVANNYDLKASVRRYSEALLKLGSTVG